jgi:hypothetical protein
MDRKKAKEFEILKDQENVGKIPSEMKQAICGLP